MKKNRHKIRHYESEIAWYIDKGTASPGHLSQPPTRDRFEELQTGDLFINWVTPKSCQIWRFSEDSSWNPVMWGYSPPGMEPIHHLVITAKNEPSLVGHTTYTKKFQRDFPGSIIESEVSWQPSFKHASQKAAEK
jgi:hypothetical protein